jgi:hypothetical protein
VLLQQMAKVQDRRLIGKGRGLKARAWAGVKYSDNEPVKSPAEPPHRLGRGSAGSPNRQGVRHPRAAQPTEGYHLDEDEPELKIIDVFVCKLRKKLAQATGGKHYIETVWGRGYVLRDPVETPITLTPAAAGSGNAGERPGSAAA